MLLCEITSAESVAESFLKTWGKTRRMAKGHFAGFAKRGRMIVPCAQPVASSVQGVPLPILLMAQVYHT